MKTAARVCISAVSIVISLSVCFLPPGSASLAATLPVYGDSLAAGWDNWSWNTTANFMNISPVFSGTYSLSATFTAAWGGLYLATNSSVPSTPYDTLQFWINGGSQGGQELRVMLSDGNYNLIDPGVAVPVNANAWTQVNVSLADLGNPAQIGGIVWQDTSGGPQPTFYLDQISLIDQGIPPAPPGQGPSLNIDTSSARHVISEGIYGMNFAPEQLAAELSLPVSRWGGNGTTRYNWQNDTSNHASDWYFENIPEDNPDPSLLPDGSAADLFVEQNRRTNTESLVTVPLIGWTPKARAVACGFSVAKYGAQQSTDPWQPDCGNGIQPDGTVITGNDPADTSTQIGPDFVKAWINYLTGKYGTAAGGGVAYYDLDNEPMLWNSTHRDVHPQPTSYDEMRNLTYQYAPAIKAVDPSAQTLGPVAWGWCEYFYSALDGCSIGIDYQSHGNTPYVAWYLQQMHAYEQNNQLRILDYLDLHYYPQANGVALSSAGDSSTQALRLRSTRSLWDPTYTDESWINTAVFLIPRMHDWVDANYPGTKLSISEYNWGGLESINGALAQADVLGIFGREGLDLATLWDPPTETQPGSFAFRMYRNYDAAGHGFGDVSVQAASADQSMLAVYAAERSADNALTIIVINKSLSDLTSEISLAGFAPAPTALVYQYGATSQDAIIQLPDQPVTASGFSTSFPGNSITLFILAPESTSNQTITITKLGTGSGSVTANPGTISWAGNTGTGTYSYNAPVTLTATADTGSTFAGWTGCDAAAGNQCSLIMSAPKTVTATFTLNQYSLTANATGTGSGTVTSSTGGINYTYPAASQGSAVVNFGTAVTLTAEAATGSGAAWSGDCDSTGGTTTNATCTIASMNMAKTVTATFTASTCSFGISPTSATFNRAGNKGSVSITASSSSCAWTAKSNVSWITITSGASGTGKGTVKYSVSKNSTGKNRTGTMTIAGRTLTVVQTK
ncbi:MAG: glycoside hydrolase family 44 protein [Dissulfurispiraceae bacterium]